MLKKRLLTYIVLVALILVWVIYSPMPVFNFFLTVLLILAVWEWTRLIGLINNWQRWGYLILLLGINFSIYLGQIFTLNVIYLALVCWFFILFAIVFYPKGLRLWANSVTLAVLGIIILISFWLSLALLRNTEKGTMLTLYLLFLVCTADTVAYLIGKLWGKHKLAKEISPGKTIQGAIGGLIGAIAASVIGGFVFSITGWQWFSWVSFAIFVALISICGDLFISMLKRQQGLKDSGKLLPGHGGVLDRLDSLLSAAPLFLIVYAML